VLRLLDTFSVGAFHNTTVDIYSMSIVRRLDHGKIQILSLATDSSPRD
jgi:hypothetical protein